MANGSLLVVGVGVGLAGQCSAEARAAIASADIVFGLMGDPLMQAWLERLNPNVRPLDRHYQNPHGRPAAYRAMVEEIVAAVEAGRNVCAAFYGHPGVFVRPSHEAIKRVRAAGLEAKMLPAISAEDCLFADLGFDPGETGLQSYEARDFFLTAPRFDPHAGLVLWQIGVLGDNSFTRFNSDPRALEALAQALQEHYPARHPVIVYSAAILPILEAEIREAPLAALAETPVTQASTLYVPPLARRPPLPDRAALLQGLQFGAQP